MTTTCVTRIYRYECYSFSCVFFNEPSTTAIYTYGHHLSLHDPLPIYDGRHTRRPQPGHPRLPVRPALRGCSEQSESRGTDSRFKCRRRRRVGALRVHARRAPRLTPAAAARGFLGRPVIFRGVSVCPASLQV